MFYVLSSVQFSHSVVSDSLWPHESQQPRPPCPSPTPRVHPDSRPSSQWCHLAISYSVIPFSSCSQSLPASESFSMSQLFAWGGQSTGVSALASFLPKKSQGWSPSEWTGWILLQSKGLSTVFSNTRCYKKILHIVPLSSPDSESWSVLRRKLFLEWCSKAQVTGSSILTVPERLYFIQELKDQIRLTPWPLSSNKSWIQVISFWQELTGAHSFTSCSMAKNYNVQN